MWQWCPDIYQDLNKYGQNGINGENKQKQKTFVSMHHLRHFIFQGIISARGGCEFLNFAKKSINCLVMGEHIKACLCLNSPVKTGMICHDYSIVEIP